MLDFILFLHGRNVYLIILAGAITGIWGLILFSRTKALAQIITPPKKISQIPVTTISNPDASTATPSTTSQDEAKDGAVASSDAPITTTTEDSVANDTVATAQAHAITEFKARTKPWRIALIITVVLGLLQGVFGIIMVILGQKPGPAGASLYYLHYVYGGIVALVIPVATSYATSGKNPRRDLLIYSIAALILTAAAVRAWMTGPAVFTLLP